MSLFRDHIRRARRQLHEHLHEPALYLPSWPYAGAGELPALPITVRVHENGIRLGDLKGTNFNYAEIEDDSPRIIFMLDEIDPARGAIISVEPGRAYRLDAREAPNDISVAFSAHRLNEREREGLPVPGDAFASLDADLPTYGQTITD